jgi:carboxymethylenebutenolidase|tara:strand:- start:1 stop:768 length:768 start_codon:yes stop_codon:yes gene_type:complete
MWNQLTTDEYEGMLAETTTLIGHNGDMINAYLARPLGPGPFPGIVLIHHMPGWDELYREIARRFAQHGYAVICPNLYNRFGHGKPDEVTTKVREQGGVPDDSVVGDCQAAMNYLKSLPNANGRVGVIGGCSGGRHAFLVGCRVDGFNAVVDLWGGRVFASSEELTAAQPVAAIDYAKDLSCPLLGLFGNDDRNPSPEQVNQLEEDLKKLGKDYEFHRYDGAGHAFWSYDRGAYRPEQAMDAWDKTFAFFSKNLQS